ncbi:MAG: hypothetical protein ACI8PZ_000250 [Myxococcota bacterium]|jgi:hypothetical protein
MRRPDDPSDDAFRPPSEAEATAAPTAVVGFIFGRMWRLAVSPLLLVFSVRIVLPDAPVMALALVAALGIGLWLLPTGLLVRIRLFPSEPGPLAMRVGGRTIAPDDHRWAARAISIENVLAMLPVGLLAGYAGLQSAAGIGLAAASLALGLRFLIRAVIPWMLAEAAVSLRLGHPQTARRWLHALLRIPTGAPVPDRARLLLARACFAESDRDGARAALGALDDPSRHSARVLLAQLDLADGDAGTARALLAEPRPSDPDALAQRMALGGMVALADGDAERATKLADAWDLIRDVTRTDLSVYELVWASAFDRTDQPERARKARERAGARGGAWVATMWPMV